MAETALTVQVIESPFALLTAGDADFTFAAADLGNGNKFACTGKEILIARNDAIAEKTLTISSVDDEKNRDGDITTYALASGDYAIFLQGMTNSKGWKQTDGTILLQASDADIFLAVLRLTI